VLPVLSSSADGVYMDEADDGVVAVSDVDGGLGARLQEEIARFNAVATGITDGRPMSAAVYGASGELEAGLSGWTWGGSGYVDVLWVRDTCRGRGLGTRLLAAAETEAVQRGCSQLALSTHTFQAPDFYSRRGYTVCGRTPDYPRGHAQLHLLKQLAAST
jgi:GNAT superfamily N-acetyltransferase